MPITRLPQRAASCLFLSAYVLLSVPPVAAQVRFPDEVTYLLPLTAANATVPGAYGSLWRTETWVRNDATEPIRLSFCPTIEPVPECTLFYQPGRTELAIDVDPATFAHASLIYVHARDAARVTISHRLLELTRHTQPNGVAIPVVSEDRFLTTPSRLIAIPSDASARVTLRVYNPRGVPDAAARIEILSTDGTTLGDAVVPFALDGEVPVRLGFIFIGDVVAAFPQAAGVQRFDIRVSAIPADLEYWTMATITDRDTQHVLVVAPE